MTHTRSEGCAESDGPERSENGVAITRRRYAKRVTFAIVAWLGMAAACPAGDLSIEVVDPAGHGVVDVVVTVTPTESRPVPSPPTPSTAIMDQRDRAFVPRVLAITVGTSVEFPNNDSVSHQVYSFSPAKKFQLPLYKGRRHPPITFDQEGLVVLGCNIHDEMVGYIYVTSAPMFRVTDARGVVQFAGVAAGEYRVTLWGPLIADSSSSLVRTVQIGADRPETAIVRLSRDLRSRPEPRPRRGDWEY